LLSRWQHPLIVLAMLPAAGASTANNTPRYVPTRELSLVYQIEGGIHSTAELWVSTDLGRSWHFAAAEPCGQQTLCYAAPADGRYDFYVVLRDTSGAAAEPPNPGSPPCASVIVDTTLPLLQVHGCDVDFVRSPPQVLLTATLIEENLGPSGLRIFYRLGDGSWSDGGPLGRVGQQLTWTPPADVAAVAALRVVVTDLAGNQAAVELPGLQLVPPPSSQPATQPADQLAASTSTSGAATSRPTALTANVQRLRELAQHFRDQGRYSLAAARIQDALDAAPRDPDLLVDLGSVLYRLGRYEDARERFQSALALSPEHIGALEGLALVAATQKRYADAREHLRHVLRLLPESGENWLRYGDVEHRLGDTAAALQAWRRVLSSEGASDDLRTRARRRVKYFSPPLVARERPEGDEARWQEPSPIRPSSSSAGTTRTRRPPP